MSIDAKIAGFSRRADGTVWIALESRDGQSGPGQPEMQILNPPPLNCDLALMINAEVWGSSSLLLIGEDIFADREGYCSFRLRDRWWDTFRRWRATQRSKGK